MATINDFPAVFPEHLLDAEQSPEPDRTWRAVYTMSRQEKSLARDLLAYEIPYYLPMVTQTKVYGRRRISTLLPVFPNYLFVWCTEDERVASLTTNRISRVLDVRDGDRLRFDLGHLRKLIESGAPLTMESRLAPGTRVRIKLGPMAGVEGVVIRRRGEQRLFVAVNFLQQGASMAVEDYMVEVCD